MTKNNSVTQEIKDLEARIEFLKKVEDQKPLKESTTKKIKEMKDLYYKDAILTWKAFRELSTFEFMMAAVKVGDDEWETTMGDYMGWNDLKEEWLEALQENPLFELWEVTELTQVI